MALTGGGEVLVGVHHDAAVGNVLLLSVVDERVTIAGGLDGVVTFLKLQGNCISLPIRSSVLSPVIIIATSIPVVLLYIPAQRGPSLDALELELLDDLELLSSFPSLFSRNMAVLYLSPCLDSLFSRKVLT